MKVGRVCRVFGVLILALRGVPAPAAEAAKPSTPAVPAAEKKEAGEGPLQNMKFRNLGPAVGGGRVTSVAGIPGDPNVIYVGAAAGGVWKSVDGGNTFKAIFEKYPSSIGAIAIAPSNPSLVWVGTGEANPRNDVMDGHGVYFSADAGNTWRFMGLADVGQISHVVIDPYDPSIVLVAALGHVWAPNADRGVYRTTDGGQTWKKVLYVDEQTGACELAMAPGNPKVLFAGMWQVRRFPWELVDGGPGSGLYRSTDGGATWTKLKKDLPEGPLGRIAVAVAPSNANHVYALIETKKGLLWDSKDGGEHWEKLSDNMLFNVRPFYFSLVTVSPADENKVYFGSYSLVQSDDGGKTFRVIDQRIHPDHHALWIDPKDSDRILQGNDGYALASTDGGKTWRGFDNIPIEQFYMVSADSSVPYNLCGGLQDNNAWCGASNSLSRGGIGAADWFVTAGGDGEYVVPAPSDPSIVYSDSQNGNINRLDKKTHLSRNIRPYLSGVSEMSPAELKHRFNWTSPIAVSARDANEVYLGGNVVFKSTDGGAHWTVISPDLTRNDKSKQVVSGGPIYHDLSGAETYDTLLSIQIAPTDPNVIWAGSDDGQVSVTRDGGRNWANVTKKIPNLPEWGRIYQIDVSPFDAGTAYVISDRHMLDDRHPYAYKTSNYGETWTSIAKGLPASATCYVVRENPNKRGFLVAGTGTGPFYSPDAGSSWKELKANFPSTPVWDVKFVKASHDLAVATHGRGLFVFDNITPIEESTDAIEGKDFHLFSAPPAALLQSWNRGGFAAGGFWAPNPPNGVTIDYFVKNEIKQTEEQKKAKRDAVRIVVTDEKGAAVTTQWAPAKEGINRHVWNMRYEGPKRVASAKEAPPNDFFEPNRGPDVVPGTYKVAVTIKGDTQTQTVAVLPDPRWPADLEALRAQTRAGLEVRNGVTALNEMINRIDSLQSQISALEKDLRGGGEDGGEASGPASRRYEAVLRAGKDLGKKLKELRDKVYNPDMQRDVGQDGIHYHTDFQGRVQRLAQALSGYNQAPGDLFKDEMAGRRRELDGYLSQFNEMAKTDISSFNKTAAEQGVPTLFAGDPIQVQAAGI
jgi:photosystem II stability/assembly factor-like uncharacterized protein